MLCLEVGGYILWVMPKMTYWGAVETVHGRLEEREFGGVWSGRKSP